MNIYDIKNFNNVFDTINKNFNSLFNDSFLSRLFARQDFNNSASLSTLFTFDWLNSIDEESDQSMSKKNAKHKIVLKVSRQKIVAHKSKFKINFRKRDKRSKTKFIDKVKRRRFKSEN